MPIVSRAELFHFFGKLMRPPFPSRTWRYTHYVRMNLIVLTMSSWKKNKIIQAKRPYVIQFENVMYI